MLKKILVINYSQSGQLNKILQNFLTSFKPFDIDSINIKPAQQFPFPWSTETFFEVMPACVLEENTELEPISFKYEKYDLIIIGYQPWFLSPSLPTTALFNLPEFKKIINNTPITTIIGSRNMWLNSQESIVKWVNEAGGKMVANIPLSDRVQNHISAITILHWMLTGKKNKKWGFLPLPGISQKDISGVKKYSKPIIRSLENKDFKETQKDILALGGISIKPSILLIESRAKKFFKIWSKLIKQKGVTPKKRKLWVSLFKWYLIIALFIISPPIIIIYTILSPLLYSSIRKKQHHYLYLGIKN